MEIKEIPLFMLAKPAKGIYALRLHKDEGLPRCVSYSSFSLAF